MNTSTIIRGLIISAGLAALATMIHTGQLTAPIQAENFGLLSTFAITTFCGILAVLFLQDAPAGEQDHYDTRQVPQPAQVAKAKSSLPAVESVVVKSDSARELGTVKWFNTKKGYGFITRDQGEDVFVHFRNIKDSNRRSLADGKRVEFVIINGDKGPQADDVSILD